MGADVTRPGGTTPRGLPYPGSDAPHANTPAALQALAEAITGQLSALPGGLIFDTWTGQVTCSATATFTIPFPNLAVVSGYVCCYGIFSAGDAYRWGSAQGAGTFPSLAVAGSMIPADWKQENFNNNKVSICAFGWGVPK